MCAQRILRAGPGADVIRSQPSRRDDPRQASFDLGAPAFSPSRAEETIYRLSHEVADLRMKLVGEGTPDSAEGTTYRSYHSGQGWIDTVDPIASMARQFAHRLADVRCIRQLGPAGDAIEDNAEAVNYYIGMIADEADALITALIEDAEACGLEASGPWMKIPLVECRKFEAIERHPELERADDIQDEKLNS